ncbi:MAG: energy-coupling factor ABC transporter ATP-binding protein [Candidatus Heimdallarchaeota archaeon]
MCIIRFKDFFFRYKGNEEYALNNINLEIKKNKFILLAGETGSGKTSLIRCMNGLIPQFYAGYYKGSVQVAEKDTSITPIADLSTEVGIVFQNPENQLIAMNIEHEIAFGMENLGIKEEIIKEKLKSVMQLTEISEIADKAPFEISGGEQQRVAIASILALDPKIIVLDEPTANLDPLFAHKIITLLKKIQRDKDLTIIISEHRMDLVIPIVDEIILMKQGKIVAHNRKEDIINSQEFENLAINKPLIYSIFNYLRKENLIHKDLPTSISEAVSLIKTNIYR